LSGCGPGACRCHGELLDTRFRFQVQVTTARASLAVPRPVAGTILGECPASHRPQRRGAGFNLAFKLEPSSPTRPRAGPAAAGPGPGVPVTVPVLDCQWPRVCAPGPRRLRLEAARARAATLAVIPCPCPGRQGSDRDSDRRDSRPRRGPAAGSESPSRARTRSARGMGSWPGPSESGWQCSSRLQVSCGPGPVTMAGARGPTAWPLAHCWPGQAPGPPGPSRER
jgi:hypothetical protein